MRKSSLEEEMPFLAADDAASGKRKEFLENLW